MTMEELATWVAGVTGVTVIIAPFNGPAPDPPYISIFDFDESGNCYPSVERIAQEGGSILYSVQDPTKLVVSFNAYAANGRELLAKVKDFASLPQVIGRPILHDVGHIRNLSFLDDSVFAPRYQCDFTFSVDSYHETIDAPVETVEISGAVAEIESEIVIEVGE
ncbi:MAG TPA: hypothetical protein VJ553_07485 [Candidatus Paceibacterota bacterium]|nr:hypothetical protein [Candidatus Paceibacterota bacterium]